MDFRFALIPAGSAESSTQASRIAAVIRGAPEQHPDSAIAEVLGALGGSPVGHYIEACRHGSRGSLLSVDHPESGFLEALLILAKDHGLAVYDVDLDRLYDPTGCVDLDVLLPGVRIPFLTRELLADLVFHPQWPDPEAAYLIVERADQDFIQAWLEDGTYRFEYREDGPESHFVVYTDDAALVIEVMWAWVIKDDSWRTAVDWEFTDLACEVQSEFRWVSLQNEQRDDGSLLSLDATLNGDGALQISGHDLGPVAEVFDGEYEWWYTVAAEDVPRLVVALGGRSGGDIVGLLAERYSGDGAYRLGPDLQESGVPYRFSCWP